MENIINKWQLLEGQIINKIGIIFLLFFLFMLLPQYCIAQNQLPVVEVKNIQYRQVLISSREIDEFHSEDDYAIVNEKGKIIAYIYPYEIEEGKFWSQSLPEESFNLIKRKMAVVKVAFDNKLHAEIRQAGNEVRNKIDEWEKRHLIIELQERLEKKRNEEKMYEYQLLAFDCMEIEMERELIDEISYARDALYDSEYYYFRDFRDFRDFRNFRDFRDNRRHILNTVWEDRDDLRKARIDNKEIRLKLRVLKKEIEYLVNRLKEIQSN